MTKDRLKQYRHIKDEIRQIKGLLEELEARVYGLQSQELSDLPRAHSVQSGSAQERAADSTMQLRDRYRAKLEELAGEQLAIEEAIETLEPTQRQMLRHKYIEGLTWEEVCVAMSYSWRQVHRLHAKALKVLREERIKRIDAVVGGGPYKYVGCVDYTEDGGEVYGSLERDDVPYYVRLEIEEK